MSVPFTRTLRFKVRPESYAWLNAAAIEVNGVFNYCNQISLATATRTDRKRKWLSGYDLCNLTAGATEYLQRIGADTIQRICVEYAQKRVAARRLKLRWRVSRGARRSLGWIPFKAASLKRKGTALRFCGKTFRVFERERLEGVSWKQGCFAQDAVGDWWLCLPVEESIEQTAAPKESVHGWRSPYWTPAGACSNDSCSTRASAPAEPFRSSAREIPREAVLAVEPSAVPAVSGSLL